MSRVRCLEDPRVVIGHSWAPVPKGIPEGNFTLWKCRQCRWSVVSEDEPSRDDPQFPIGYFGRFGLTCEEATIWSVQEP